jgi:membrane protease YdiL (CAAX protease family)
MISLGHKARARPGQATLLALAWSTTLLISTLPNIIWQEFIGAPPAGLFWTKIVLLAALICLTFVWHVARPLRPYFAIFLVLYLAEEALGRLGTTSLWQSWFGGIGVSFTTEMLGIQLRRLAIAVIVIAMLLLMYRRRSDFFLVKGQLDAPARPIRWLGMARPASWSRFGWILTLCISLGLLAFLVLAGRPTVNTLVQALPFLPVVLILAAMNAFSEEMNYRAALLAPLHGVVGRQQALLLTAAFFGLGHFYGVPYGVIGVIMAGFLAWLLGKSMLETKGFFWAWFIHFWQDVFIFSFMAMGSISAGGS